MNKKVLIQITLLVIIVLILATLFTFYQSKKGKNSGKKEKKVFSENQKWINIIKNITYIAKDDRKIFKIESNLKRTRGARCINDVNK